jgi:hypothetical protein
VYISPEQRTDVWGCSQRFVTLAWVKCRWFVRMLCRAFACPMCLPSVLKVSSGITTWVCSRWHSCSSSVLPRYWRSPPVCTRPAFASAHTLLVGSADPTPVRLGADGRTNQAAQGVAQTCQQTPGFRKWFVVVRLSAVMDAPSFAIVSTTRLQPSPHPRPTVTRAFNINSHGMAQSHCAPFHDSKVPCCWAARQEEGSGARPVGLLYEG